MYKSKFLDPAAVEMVLGYDASGNPFNDRTLENFLWPQLFKVACGLLYLTSLLNVAVREQKRIGAREQEYSEDTFAACQHALVSFSHPSDVLVKTTMYYRQDCWRLAALIYFNTAIRVSPSPRLLASMTARLIESLQESDISSGWRPNSGILLWILFTGYCGSLNSFEKGWLMQESKRVARVMDLKTADEMEDVLEAFHYRKATYGKLLYGLWEKFDF